MSPQNCRELLKQYVDLANALDETPQFYRTILANCTTVIWEIARRIDGRLPLDWRLILTGHFNAFVFDRGGFDMRYSLEELREIGAITGVAQASGGDADFSAAIRAGVPALPSD